MTTPAIAETIETVKREYEAVGNEVRELLGRLRDEDLGKKSGNARWKVRTVAAHLATSPGQVAPYTDRVKMSDSASIA